MATFKKLFLYPFTPQINEQYKVVVIEKKKKNAVQGSSNENSPTAAFSVVFYNMLLIKNLKPEEEGFIFYKKTRQSCGLVEKVVRQALRGHR